MSDPRVIAVTTHGRYVVQEPSAPRTSRTPHSAPHPAPRTSHPAPVLVGFHGYAESAVLHLDRLKSIPGSDGWLLVSIQGLHRFYRRRSEDVVASWMTRQDREHMIDDNIAYVSAVLDEVVYQYGNARSVVFAGFSQGVATAFRAACRGSHSPGGVIALGGDVPPDLSPAELARVPRAFVARGERDEWQTAAKLQADEARLLAAGVNVSLLQFDGGHEWTPDFSRAAGEFLQSFD